MSHVGNISQTRWQSLYEHVVFSSQIPKKITHCIDNGKWCVERIKNLAVKLFESLFICVIGNRNRVIVVSPPQLRAQPPVQAQEQYLSVQQILSVEEPQDAALFVDNLRDIEERSCLDDLCEIDKEEEIAKEVPDNAKAGDFPYGGKYKEVSREKVIGFESKINNAILAEKEAVIAEINLTFSDTTEEKDLAHKILSDLVADDLLPTHRWKSGNGVSYYYTDPFEIRGHGKIAVMCFVKIKGEDKVYPRIFSLSGSQGTWRTYPQAQSIGDLDPEIALPEEYLHRILGHFNKGKDEQALNLPISVNLKLHELLANTPPKQLEHFYEMDVLRKSYPLMTLFKKTIRKAPFCEIKSGAGVRPNRAPDNPSDCKLKEEASHPNFSQLLFSQKLNLSEYGEVIAKIYPSKNGSLHYLFYETADEKTFLATVEQIRLDSHEVMGANPITTFGNRQYYLGLLKAVAIPLYEYVKQIPPEYRVVGHAKNNYELNWNRVRESSLIKDYYLEQGRKIPGLACSVL